MVRDDPFNLLALHPFAKESGVSCERDRRFESIFLAGESVSPVPSMAAGAKTRLSPGGGPARITTPNIAPQLEGGANRPPPISRHDAKAGERSFDVMR